MSAPLPSNAGLDGASPHVVRLLDEIRGRNAADRKAVFTLAMHGLQYGPDHRREDSDDGPLFIFRREDMPAYLRASGIELWHRATWLRVEEPGGAVVADVPLPTVMVGPIGASLRRLTESALLEACACGSTRAAMADGTITFAFTADELAGLLLIARHVARRALPLGYAEID